MPYTITWEQAGRGVVITWEGEASAAELHEVNQQIYSPQPPTTLRYQIWDFSRAVRAKKARVSAEDARDLAIEDGEATGRTQPMSIALVGSEEYFGGLDRLYAIFAGIWADKVRFEVFSDLVQARAWIAAEPST